MAVVNTLSTAITNADASPRVANSSYIECGKLRSSVGTVEVATGDSVGSVYRFCRLPSGARVVSIRIFCDALGGSSAYDCGIYQTAANGGAVVDADSFGSAVSTVSAITVGTEIRFEAADIAQVEKRIFEQAGIALSADPYISYDLALTTTAVAASAGTISLVVQWVI